MHSALRMRFNMGLQFGATVLVSISRLTFDWWDRQQASERGVLLQDTVLAHDAP